MPARSRRKNRTTPISSARLRRLAALRPALDRLYAQYNDRQFVDPDPLAPVYRYATPGDRELAGLVAAALAFGNVKQILGSIDRVLVAIPEPVRAVPGLSEAEMRTRLSGFRHRYVTGIEVASLLAGAGAAVRDYGSLGACLAAHDDGTSETLLPALTGFVDFLRNHGSVEKNYLLPDPGRGSACKRWFMYLRWMVREDAVDLGHWRDLGAHRLIIPVDTHMHRVARGLGLTRRNSADLKTALEITGAFRVLCPEDPVRYDFCLTRLGIRPEGDMPAFIREAGAGQVR